LKQQDLRVIHNQFFMMKVANSIACLLLLAFVFSCKKKEQAPSVPVPLTLESRNIQQSKGTDCGKEPDSLRTDCAIIDFQAPKLSGNSALAKNVDAWVDQYLIHLLTWSDYNEAGKEPKTMEAAIKRFHAIHDEAAGSVSSGQFNAKCTFSPLLNNGQYLTLMLDGHSFVGGNRPLNAVGIASFDVKTGKQLTWDDLVMDKAAVLAIAEANFRETWKEEFDNGFSLDEPFPLPEAYGLTDEGILMHYQADEIYRMGGTTEFTITYDQLGDKLKTALPLPGGPAETAEDDALMDIYQAAGDSLVIPTFEIEVSNSPQSGKTLAKKKETIIVSAMFYGLPLDPNEKAKGEDGFLSFGNKEIELTGNSRVARFEGLKFSKKQLALAESKDIDLLINIYSGRKSSENNLLNCGILDMKASAFANKRFVLGCQLIDETEQGTLGTAGFPIATYALGENGAQPALLVECSEKGEISFAGQPMKDLDALKAALRPVLAEKIKNGAKELPEIETAGCMMGNSGAIRDMYEALKTELSGKATSTPDSKEKALEKASTAKELGTKPALQAKGLAKPSATDKAAAKPAAAPSTAPTVTLKQNGDLLLNGKPVGTFEELRKQLQAALSAQAIIPDKVELKTIGETGMGARGEVNSIMEEAVKGAKWLRKKAAIETLNTAVGKKLGLSTQLELGTYQTSGNFAYISALPKQADGKAIDYSKTDYAKDAKAGSFANNTIGLLQYEKGSWKLLTFSIGVSKPPVEAWAKSYKAPKALFGKEK
jgi:hypothetical protein